MVIKLKLPDSAKIAAKKSDKLSFGDLFYSQSQESQIRVPICEKLGVKNSDIFQVLTVVVGDSVEKGTVLAQKKAFLGRKDVKSPYDGTVKHVHHDSGEISIAQQEGSNEDIMAFFEGKISEVNKNIVSIDIAKGKTFALSSVHGSSGGKIQFIDEKTDYFSIDGDMVENTIVVVENMTSHLETKLETLAVKGFIYTNGTTTDDVPNSRLKSKDDISIFTLGKCSHVIFSEFEKKGIAYNI